MLIKEKHSFLIAQWASGICNLLFESYNPFQFTMKLLFLFPLFLFSVMITKAQNLVPNASFEEYIDCPTAGEQMYNCADWWSAGLANTTPDYFNACSINPSVAPPHVNYGYQVPFSGIAYALVVTYYKPVYYREYIQAMLNLPLIAGNQYYVSFYASLPGGQNISYAANKLGAFFTSYKFEAPHYAQPINFAHVYTDSILSDTVNWYHIQGIFTADSAYQYITIGNFFDDQHTDTVNYGNSNAYSSAYYIDEVCVSTDSAHCYIAEGITGNIQDDFAVYPVPADDYIVINYSGKSQYAVIIDDLGNKIAKLGREKESKKVIDCSRWLNGVYYLILDNILKKIIIEHD